MKKNGYFMVSVKPDGTYITVTEPDEGAKGVTADEIVFFFDI